MTTLEQIFVRDCIRHTNAIHARQEREFRNLLLSFAVLVLLLIGATFALIHVKFEPGHKQVQIEEGR